MSNSFIGKQNGAPWFGRTYSLKFYNEGGDLIKELYSDSRNDWRGLRIVFKITQQMFTMNQFAQIDLYNLSDATKKQISSAYKVTLTAGYQLSSGIIYIGEVVNVFFLRQQPEYILRFLCLDYVREYAPVSVTIPAGTLPIDAIKSLVGKVKDLEVSDYNLKSIPTAPITKTIHIPQEEYTQAFSDLGEAINCNIWVTNGQVNAISNNITEFPEDAQAVQLNYNTGLIGSPVFDLANTAVNCISLLNHRILPGNMLQIDTLNPDVQIGQANYVHFEQDTLTRGKWLVQSVTHEGDNWAGTFTTFSQSYNYAPLGANVV